MNTTGTTPEDPAVATPEDPAVAVAKRLRDIEEKRYLTCDDSALVASVTVDTVRAWIATRQLIAADVSRGRGERPRWRIDRADLERFLASRRTVEPPPSAIRRKRPAGIPRYV